METLDPKTFAARIGISAQAARQWALQKKVAHQKVGGKIRILASEVARFLTVIPVATKTV